MMEENQLDHNDSNLLMTNYMGHAYRDMELDQDLNMTTTQ